MGDDRVKNNETIVQGEPATHYKITLPEADRELQALHIIVNVMENFTDEEGQDRIIKYLVDRYN